MTNEEIMKWLRSKKVETGSLLCLGCGHEHNCGIHGCAVMRAAASSMENLQTENAALRHHIETLTSAQVVMVKEFTEKMEELAQVKAERDAAYQQLGGEPPKTCKTCELWGKSGWGQYQVGYCEGDDHPHGPDDFCSRHCPKKEA